MCTAFAWLLGRRRRRRPLTTRPTWQPAGRSSVLVALEWLCLLSGIASSDAGPLHAFANVVHGDRSGRHALRLLLLGGSFLLRRLRTGRLIRRTGMEGPILLVLAGQALPHVLMRDGPRHPAKAVRTAAALGMYYAVLDVGRCGHTAIAAAVAVNATILSAHWPTTWNFSALPNPYRSLQRIGLAINRSIGPLPGPRLHKNRAGAIIGPSIPIALGLACQHWRRRREHSSARVAFFGLLPLVSAGGLVLAFSRTSWLGVVGSAAIVSLAAVQRRWFPTVAKRAIFWTCVLLGPTLAGVTLARDPQLGSRLRRLERRIPSIASRRELARSGVALIRDHRYTGVGHPDTRLLHAVYSLLNHAPRYSYVHNVYLGTWLEDGLLGAAGLAWGVLTALRWGWRACGRPDLPPLAIAGFASMAVTGITGLGDDHFTSIYRFYTTDWTRPRVLLAPAVLLGVAAGLARDALPDDGRSAPSPWVLLLGGPVLAGWAVRNRRVLMAAWHANLGALLQTHYELGRYDPSRFDRPLLDELRRDGAALAPAETRLRRALASDPRNVTALQRLGAIALSRGRYGEAGRLLRQAWAAGHRDRVTRLLYGDVLVAEGREAEAAAILRGLELAASRLHFQAWYRYEIGGDHRRAAHARGAAAALEAASSD